MANSYRFIIIFILLILSTFQFFIVQSACDQIRPEECAMIDQYLTDNGCSCLEVPCLNGQVQVAWNTATCQCYVGWSGSACEICDPFVCPLGSFKDTIGCDCPVCPQITTGSCAIGQFVTSDKVNQSSCSCTNCSACSNGQYRSSDRKVSTSCQCIPCPNNCSGHGTQSFGAGTSQASSCQCTCNELFSGPNCATCNPTTCPNGQYFMNDGTSCKCTSCASGCNGRGTQTFNADKVTACKCACTGNWSGDNCETCPLSSTSCAIGTTFDAGACACKPCSPTTCSSGQFRAQNSCTCTACTTPCNTVNGGKLISDGNTSSSCKCQCSALKPWWTGSSCETCVPAQLPCTTAQIKDTTNGKCECKNCPTCSNGGTITTTGNTCGCSCSGNWGGPTCSTCSILSCPVGQTLNSSTCQCEACSSCLAGQYRNQGSCTCVDCPNRGCTGHGTQPISNIQSTSCTCTCRNSWSDNACGTCNLSSCPPGQTLSDCSCINCPSVGCNGHGTQNSNCSCTCNPNWSGTNCQTCSLTTANCAASISTLNASTCSCTACSNMCPPGQIRTSNGTTCGCTPCTNTCDSGQYRTSTGSTTCGCTNCNQSCQHGGTLTSDRINSNSCGCNCSSSTPQWGGSLCDTCDGSKLTCNSATQIKDITNGKCECLTCPTCLHSGTLTTTNNQCTCNCAEPWTNNRCQDCSLTSESCAANEAFIQSSCKCTPCTKTCTAPDVLNYWSCSCVNESCQSTTCPNNDEYINDSTSACQCEKCPTCLNNGIAYSESNQCFCDCTKSNNNGVWIGEQCQMCSLAQNQCTSTQQLNSILCQCDECSTLLSNTIINGCTTSGGNIHFSTTTSQCQCQCPNDKIWNNNTNQCELRCQDNNYIWNENESKCKCNLSCSTELNQIPNDNCTECILDNSKCQALSCQNNGQPSNDCTKCECNNELNWIGDKCEICNANCATRSSDNKPTISCECNCAPGFIGKQCECVKTKFVITLGSVPKTILTTYQQDPTSLTLTESSLITMVFNALQTTLTSQSTTIDNLQIESLEIKNGNGEQQQLLIRGFFIDGCDIDSSKYGQLLTKWTSFLNQFTTIKIDDEDIQITDASTESPIASCQKENNVNICTLGGNDTSTAPSILLTSNIYFIQFSLLFIAFIILLF